MTTIFKSGPYDIRETAEGKLVSCFNDKVRPITRKTFKGFESDATREILIHRGIPSNVVARIVNQAYGY